MLILVGKYMVRTIIIEFPFGFYLHISIVIFHVYVRDLSLNVRVYVFKWYIICTICENIIFLILLE